ncbi:MAG: site-specific integrase [Bacteroidia bacterium]|nr:site-specific integrase [Bacteroidia bacterium]MBT8287539.1 site-specific integrase [Bacteroidia bacterium]NNK69803.1 tyrosine-type recombinase/integrase [Flavobacteriaceae bacterium]
MININIMSKNKRNLAPYRRKILNGFYLYLKGKRYSMSTIRAYTYHMADLLSYYADLPLDKFTNRSIERYVETIFIKRCYAISTQRQLVSALKLFIKYFPYTKIDELELERPEASKILPAVLSKREVIDLIRSTRNLKHRAIVAMIYSSGLRISELINLKLNDIDIDRRQIFIRDAKGRKDRYVMLSEGFLPLFQNYLVTYRPAQYFAEGPDGAQYTASSVRKFLKRSCDLARIGKRVTPHTLRHSYATHLLENGVSVRHIQELLGHAKPETTMIYTHIAKKDLLNIRSPLDTILLQLTQSKDRPPDFLLSENYKL